MKMYKYNLKRSNRKTISLEITKELEVLVRAPMKMPMWDIDRFVEDHEKWIEKNLDKMRARLEGHREPAEEEIARLKKSASEYLPGAVEYYSSVMGLKAAYVKITSAKTRFGSCGPNNGICFSWRLMRYPKQAVDYVVVHELAHIAYRNHGRLFYKCIEEVMPDYKERRKLLKA